MFEKIKVFIFGKLLGKFLLGFAVKAHDKVDGYKTQIGLVLAACMLAAGFFGIVTLDVAIDGALVFGGSAIVPFIQKLKKYRTYVDKAQAEIKKAKAKK